jgi:uncharacterized protein (UPF0332 family)
MSLRDWVDKGWLQPHTSSEQEIADLLGIIERDIESAELDVLDPDWRLNIAYNACLQCATAALAASGYRAARVAHHVRVIQSLAFTLGLEDGDIDLLDTFRRTRHVSDYERAGEVSEQEVRECLDLAVDLRAKLLVWLAQEHPHLLRH